MSCKQPNKFFSSQGFTLIEIMVALTVGSILMLAVGNVYTNSKRSYKVSDEYSILQENARLVFRLLTQDVRMAGHIGCARSSLGGGNVFNTLDLNDLTQGEEDLLGTSFSGLDGYDADNTGPNSTLNLASPPAGFNRTVNALFTGHKNGSDILVVRHAKGLGARVAEHNLSDSINIQDKGAGNLLNDCHVPSGICKNDVVIASDCSKARIFQVTNLTQMGGGDIQLEHDDTGTPGNDIALWGGDTNNKAEYFDPTDSEIFKLGATAYYVGTGANGLPSLMGLTYPNAAPQELVEGVENMQILYGIDSSGDGRANQYFIAPTTSGTSEMVSIRVSLLMRTLSELPKRNPDTKTYKMISANDAVNVRVTPIPDRRMRKVFTTTIKLRNLGLIDE